MVQLPITIRLILHSENLVRNINVKINDNNKMSMFLVPGSLIRKYFDIVKTLHYPDYGTVIKATIINVTVIEKNIITKSVVVKIDTCVCLHRPIIVN